MLFFVLHVSHGQGTGIFSSQHDISWHLSCHQFSCLCFGPGLNCVCLLHIVLSFLIFTVFLALFYTYIVYILYFVPIVCDEFKVDFVRNTICRCIVTAC